MTDRAQQPEPFTAGHAWATARGYDLKAPHWDDLPEEIRAAVKTVYDLGRSSGEDRRLPHADPTDTRNGWTLDPAYLQHVVQAVEEKGEESVTMEQVEAVLLSDAALGSSRGDRRTDEPPDNVQGASVAGTSPETTTDAELRERGTVEYSLANYDAPGSCVTRDEYLMARCIQQLRAQHAPQSVSSAISTTHLSEPRTQEDR